MGPKSESGPEAEAEFEGSTCAGHLRPAIFLKTSHLYEKEVLKVLFVEFSSHNVLQHTLWPFYSAFLEYY